MLMSLVVVFVVVQELEQELIEQRGLTQAIAHQGSRARLQSPESEDHGPLSPWYLMIYNEWYTYMVFNIYIGKIIYVPHLTFIFIFFYSHYLSLFSPILFSLYNSKSPFLKSHYHFKTSWGHVVVLTFDPGGGGHALHEPQHPPVWLRLRTLVVFPHLALPLFSYYSYKTPP